MTPKLYTFETAVKPTGEANAGQLDARMGPECTYGKEENRWQATV